VDQEWKESQAVTEARQRMLAEFASVFSVDKHDSVPRFKERFQRRMARLQARFEKIVAEMP